MIRCQGPSSSDAMNGVAAKTAPVKSRSTIRLIHLIKMLVVRCATKMFLINVQPNPTRGTYTLVKSVIIEGIRIDAPFEFNGASIPRILWEEIGSPFDPRFMAPAVVHDYIYGAADHCGMTRKEADKLFLKLLLHNNVGVDLANTMYAGVRIGGLSSWGSVTK